MKSFLSAAQHILVGGHRGCLCTYPENSIEAMQEGLLRGADYFEIDIQLTKDEIPVVYHDTRLEQKTSLHGYVHEYTYAQLQKEVPQLCTLHEALTWGKANGAYFALEIKTVPLEMQSYNLRLMELICALLQQTDMRSAVFVFGQDYQVLRYLHTVDSQVCIGLIVPFVPSDPVALMREMHATVYLSYIYNMTAQIIRDLHAEGYFVSGAILRDDFWVEQAVSLGVDMFESDHPEKYNFAH